MRSAREASAQDRMGVGREAASGDEDFLRKDNALAAGLRWLWLALLSWASFGVLGLWLWRWWP